MKDGIIAIVITVIIVIGMVFVGLAICSGISEMDYGVKQGIVIDKDYSSAHTYTSYTTSYVGNSTIRIPHQEYIDEKYRIRIEKTEEGKTKNRWIEVTAEEYNSLQIGDRYGGYTGE